MKLQRGYLLTIQGRFGTTYKFTDPITCVFDVYHRNAGGTNSGRFQLYNLSPTTIADLEFDSAIDLYASGGSIRRAFQFRAGYKSEATLPVLFEGNIKKAFSYRDNVDVVTDIEVVDGLSAAQQAQVASTASYPWDAAAEAKKLIATLAPYGVKYGAVGTLFDGYKPQRGVTWLGSTWDVLKSLARRVGGYAFIHHQRVYLLDAQDALVVPGYPTTLDATTGLLGTPRRSGYVVDADMLFEPGIHLDQKLEVKSDVNRNIRGTYKTIAVRHHGTISGAVDRGVVTSLSLYGPPTPFVLVAPA